MSRQKRKEKTPLSHTAGAGVRGAGPGVSRALEGFVARERECGIDLGWESRAAPLVKGQPGTSLAVQWLRLHASNAGGTGSIPGQGTKIPHAAWQGQRIKF